MYDIKFFFWTPSAGGCVKSVGAAVPAVHGPGGGEEEGAVGEMDGTSVATSSNIVIYSQTQRHLIYIFRFELLTLILIPSRL